MSVLYCAHLYMKCSLGISSFLEEMFSFSHSIVSSIALHCSLEAFLYLLAVLGNSAFSWVCLSLSPLPSASLLSSAICKASSDNHKCLLAFLLLWDGFGHRFLYDVVNLRP